MMHIPSTSIIIQSYRTSEDLSLTQRYGSTDKTKCQRFLQATTSANPCAWYLFFFCVYPTGLYENYPTNAEPECCDVRWGLLSDHQPKGTIKTSGSTMCHRTSLTVSSASRLCNSRLKLCVLVLILLHTVLTVSAAQNSTGLGFGSITALEDNSTNEE